jgi:sodium/proline symporter
MTGMLLVSFVIYFSILFSIGALFYKKSNTEQGFILGNRSFSFWVTAIATQSSDMGSWLFLAFPAAVYLNGYLELWTIVGLTGFMYLTWQFIAPKIRQQTELYNVFTLWSFFEKKFGDTSSLIRIVCASITVFFFMYYVAAGLAGAGRVFESAFQLPYFWGVLFATAFTILYTLIGGFFAVSWSNVFKGIFLFVVIIFVPIISLYHVGGPRSVFLAAHAKNIYLSNTFSLKNIFWGLLTAAGWGLGYFGMPHILVNFMSIKNPEEIQKAKFVGVFWQLSVLIASACIGFIAMAYFNNQIANPEQIFYHMATTLFSPIIAGFALCGVLASTIALINTQLIVASTSISEDLYKVFSRQQPSSQKIVLVSRISTVCVGIVSTIIALLSSQSLYNFTRYPWSGLGASFGPTVLLALYGKNISWQGALSGIIIGALITGFWPLFELPMELALVVGFVANASTALIVSKLTKKI